MVDAGRTRLGKGLSALLGESPADGVLAPPERCVREVPVARCTPNPHQPRERFDPRAEETLAASVRDRGVLQPILVTPDERGGYRIVAGERRWRAARAAGLESIPALVRKLGAREMLELALVENLQREDLNAIEQARGYRELAETFELGHGEIGERVGRDRSTVANTLRLLELPGEVQELLQRADLSMGHARALLGLAEAAEQVRLARETAAAGLSVRQVEARVRRARAGPSARAAPRAEAAARVRHLEEDLQRALGARVRILHAGRGSGGRIEIRFHSADEFERLREVLLRGGR